MFKNDVLNYKCFVTYGYNIIKELKNNLKQPGKLNKPVDLEQCINAIFKNGDIVDIDENNTVDDVANDGGIVERIHNDYNLNNSNIDDKSGILRNTNNASNTSAIVNNLRLSNIFNLGHAKKVESNRKK